MIGWPWISRAAAKRRIYALALDLSERSRVATDAARRAEQDNRRDPAHRALGFAEGLADAAKHASRAAARL